MNIPDHDADDTQNSIDPRPAGRDVHGLSRRRLLASAGTIGGIGVLLPVLGVGASTAPVAASPAATGADPVHALFLGSLTPNSSSIAVFTTLLPASHSLDVEYLYSNNGPTDQQTAYTQGNLSSTITLIRPLADMGVWNLLWQVREGNFSQVVDQMEIVTSDSSGTVLSVLTLFNAWVSAISVDGDTTNGMFETVNLTCDNFQRTS